MNKGFSLIELIASLLILGVLAMTATISLLPLSDALLQARANVDSVHKAQLALERMKREFTTITNVVSSGQLQMVYDFLDPMGNTHRHTISWSGVSGDPLLLQGIPLSDDVRHFELRYYQDAASPAQAQWALHAPLIEVVLHSQRGSGAYTNRITPRNVINRGG